MQIKNKFDYGFLINMWYNKLINSEVLNQYEIRKQ